MKKIVFKQNPLENKRSVFHHKNWFKRQFNYFSGDCKLLREKKLEDFILNNGFKKIHVIRDNTVLDDFLQRALQISQVPLEDAELLIITDQRFSRLSSKNIINSVAGYLEKVPNIYLCLNKLYLNYNDEFVPDSSLPDQEDAAVTAWLKQSLPHARIFNIGINFRETGANFTFVMPPSEHLICRN